MIAAIYARKSTRQEGVADEAKSVTRQVDNARAFVAKKGWTTDDAYVFEDDGKSGAEFERRPGLQRLLSALKPKPPFNVLVVSEQKSLGREQFDTGHLIKQLAQAGVEIFEYVHGQSLTPKNWLDKAMSAMRSAADEAHREQTRERVHEAHLAKVKKGYVVGGRVFGYRNVDIMNGTDQHGRPLRSHVEREIDAVEAAVVVRIFELYASGLGLKAIAKRLTNEGAAHPKRFRRTDGLTPIVGWSPSTIRTILGRELYHGVLVWNRSRKRDDWGQVDQRRRPKEDWVSVPVEDLQIVSEDLWTRVRSRRADTETRTLRFDSGRISGRPPRTHVRNLLAGLATCGVCGGGLVVETSSRKRGRVSEYVCHRRRKNGSCSNKLRVAVKTMNEAVLQAIEEHALTPEAVEQVVQLTERDDARDQEAALRRDLNDVEKRIARLVAAIETGGDAASLVAKVRDLETRKDAIERDLRGLQPMPRLAPKVIEDRLAEWRRLLRQSTTQGRAVLQRVLCGRITFTPKDAGYGAGYEFEAPTRFDKLFAGVVCERPAYIKDSTEGKEHIGPEDTFDGDYGRLLAAVQKRGKGMASPTGHTLLWKPEIKGKARVAA